MGCCQNKGQTTNLKRIKKKITAQEQDRLEKIASKIPVRKVYNLISVIGTGGFGTVKKANRKANMDTMVAIKIIDITKLKNKQYMMLRELEILKTLDHPNIIKFYEVYQDKQYFYIVMEYCSGGELLDKITQRKFLKEREAAVIMKKIISAVNHMHKKGIVHRDLKPENVLFSNDNIDSEIKIIDFGLANKFQRKVDTMVGTPYYVAPEILSEMPYDQQCDMWSVGVILYILLCGYPPFSGDNKNEVFYNIKTCNYNFNRHEWNKVSRAAKQFISQLLTLDTKKRLSAKQALDSPWFKSFEINRRMSVRGDLPDDKVDPNILNMLKNFHTTSKFKREVMKIFVNQINEREIQQIKENFQKIDKDQTGLIRIEELQQVLKDSQMYSTEEEIQRLMKTISPEDDNNQPSIRYSEFIAACLDQRKFLTKEKLLGLFKYFDPSDTGFITLDDLIEILKRNGRHMSKQEVQEMIMEVDPNNDQKISEEEFVQLMIGHNNFHDQVMIGIDVNDNLKQFNSTDEVQVIQQQQPKTTVE